MHNIRSDGWISYHHIWLTGQAKQRPHKESCHIGEQIRARKEKNGHLSVKQTQTSKFSYIAQKEKRATTTATAVVGQHSRVTVQLPSDVIDFAILPA